MPNTDEKTPSMLYHFKCPRCGKRLFDSHTLPQERITVSIKCPNCKVPVVIEMSRKNLMSNRAYKP